MLENSLESLADAIRVHAVAMAELAEALKRAPVTAANDTPFADAKKVQTGEDPMDPPFEHVAPSSFYPKHSPEPTAAPSAEEALKGIPVPEPTPAPFPEKAPDPEPSPAPVEPVAPASAYTLEDARAFVCRILKWSRTAANAEGANPLDKLFADVGAKRVQALTPEQCTTFCTNAAEFCKAHEVA